MFEIPDTTVDNLPRFADWVELCALAGPTKKVSQSVVADVAKDAGLVEGLTDDLFPGDITFDDLDTFSPDDVSQHLQLRADTLGSNYPFIIENDQLERRTDAWSDFAAYVLLLVADLSRCYSVAADLEPGSSFQYLFEKVVQAAGLGLAGGASVRFGWPREKHWPKPVNKRIRRFADAMRLPMENLRGKTHSKEKDRGLDVAIRFGFPDDGPATLILLTQCATGKHWRKKRGEPSIAHWRDILQWQGHLVRAVAIPWRLTRPTELVSAYRHFDDAVILDRPRLAAGGPDSKISNDIKKAIVRWCARQLKKLPTVGA